MLRMPQRWAVASSPPPGGHPSPRNQEAEDDDDEGVQGGGGGCRPVKDNDDDDDRHPDGIWRCLSPANRPSAAGGGWGKGLSGSLPDEETMMWNSDHKRGALVTKMRRGAGTGGW
jgi:hypothetical protein